MIKKYFLCAALLFLTSCLTQALWGDSSYEENIEQFFVGADGRYVVLVGEKFHYVFAENSGIFKEILSLKQKGVLTINNRKSHLKLEENNDVKGEIVIEGPFSVLPIEDIGVLTSLNLRPNREDLLSVKIKVAGRRYASRYLGQGLVPLTTSNKIVIYYNDSGLIKGVGKAAVTPIAVTLDAVLLIGKVVIAPLSL